VENFEACPSHMCLSPTFLFRSPSWSVPELRLHLDSQGGTVKAAVCLGRVGALKDIVRHDPGKQRLDRAPVRSRRYSNA
jgi:hypothetical protein